MLSRIEIAGVRNLDDLSLDFHQNLNLVCGQNASGKTSLLEAIGILASGKSFRTNSLENVITHDAEALRVFGKTGDGSRLGYQWSKKTREIRINGEIVSRSSLLAQALPLQSFTPDTHTEFTRDRKYRIAVLDWLLFHVEQGFHEDWSRYQRILAQRNAALKLQQDPSPWDADLVTIGEKIILAREVALDWIKPILKEYCLVLPGTGAIEARLKKGWASDKTLAKALSDDADRDKRDGYTHSGAHRSDLVLELDGRRVREEASQGQLKILVMALRLSQLKYFIDQTGKPCIFLLDDLPAELDETRRLKVLSLLAQMPLQVFITSTESGLIDLGDWPEGHQLFHVEQGKISSN